MEDGLEEMTRGRYEMTRTCASAGAEASREEGCYKLGGLNKTSFVSSGDCEVQNQGASRFDVC